MPVRLGSETDRSPKLARCLLSLAATTANRSHTEKDTEAGMTTIRLFRSHLRVPFLALALAEGLLARPAWFPE